MNCSLIILLDVAQEMLVLRGNVLLEL